MTPIPIDTSDSLAKFVDDVDALHDALLHEAVLMHPGYVDSNRQMWFETEPLNARLIFQSQAPDFSAVQLNLRGVKSLRVDTNLEFRLEVEYHNGELLFYPSGKSNADRCEIRARQAEYIILGPEFLGSEYRLTNDDSPTSDR